MSGKLSVAVLTDLHAHTLQPDDPSAPSHLSLHSPQDAASNSPFAALRRAITENGLRADLLLCGGDMGDKANNAAQQYVWAQLHQLKDQLGASRIIATAGNHDMDSRYIHDFDAKGALQALSPLFPGLSEAECDRFWSRHFVVADEADWRILILNSAAYHGARGATNASSPGSPKGQAGLEELLHGRVSLRTIEAIKLQLASAPRKPLNILLTHHHPVRNTEIPGGVDYSEMEAGDQLIGALNDLNVGDWIVVHGHKHIPRIWYAATAGGRSPVILSAGSFSARLYPEIAGVARNQFYIVDFPIADIATFKVGVIGRIRAWDWAVGQGWVPAKESSGIANGSGFGWRENTNKIAQEISNAFDSANVPFLQWDRLATTLPLLPYLSPSSLKEVQRELSETHGLLMYTEPSGTIQLGRGA